MKKILIATCILMAIFKVALPQENIAILFVASLFEVLVFAGTWKLLKKLYNWLRPKKSAIKQERQDVTEAEVVQELRDLPVKITSKLEPTLPPETILRDMRESYSLGQMKNDVRRLGDCLDIVEKTKNIDTFVERAEMGMQIALTLRQANQAQIPGVENGQAILDTFMAVVADQKPRILQDSFEDEYNKIEAYKTTKTKLNHWHAYLDKLNEHEDYFDLECEEQYYKIKSYVETQIANLNQNRKG